jgi:HEAT repeat protein
MRFMTALFALCAFSIAGWASAQAVKDAKKAPLPPGKSLKAPPAAPQPPRIDAKSKAAVAPAAAEPSVEDLARQLASSDAKARQAAADQLADLGRRAAPATPALAKALASDDADTRWRAARALAEIGSGAASAAEAITGKLNDREPLVRAHAARALGSIGAAGDSAVPKLVETAADEDARVRRAAIGSLIRLNADRAVVVPLFRKALEDAEPSVLMPALHQLTEMGDQAVPLLEEALKSENARYWALLALADMGPKAAAAADGITAALGDEKPEIRMQAAMALGAIGAEARTAGPALVKALDDEQPSVRYGAAYALGKVGDRRAGAALQKTAASDDEMLSMISNWAIAQMNPNDPAIVRHAAEAIIKALESKNPHVRAGAVRALVELKAPPELTAPAFERAISDVDPGVIANTMDALVALGPKAVPRVAGALKSPKLHMFSARILQRIGPDAASAVPQLIEALKTTDDVAFRREVNFALAAIGPASVSAVPDLAKTFDSEELAYAQPSAAYALGKIGPAAKAAVPALRKELEASEDPLHKMAAMYALRKIQPEDMAIKRAAIPLAVAGLSHERDLVRIESANSLGEIGVAGPRVIDALKKAVEDENGAVRDAAKRALEKLEGAKQ